MRDLTTPVAVATPDGERTIPLADLVERLLYLAGTLVTLARQCHFTGHHFNVTSTLLLYPTAADDADGESAEVEGTVTVALVPNRGVDHGCLLVTLQAVASCQGAKSYPLPMYADFVRELILGSARVRPISPLTFSSSEDCEVTEGHVMFQVALHS